MAVHLQNSDGSGWHSFLIYGSLVQGNLEGQPAFCMVIAAVLLAAAADPRIASHKDQVRHWLYVDDWIIQAPVNIISEVLDCVLTAAANRNLQLQLSKCCFHVPSLAAQTVDGWSTFAKAFCERVPHCQEGITMLGTDACGDLAQPLYDQHRRRQIPEPTLKRKQKAIALAEATLEMISLAPPASAKQAGYTIARRVIAHALDYDAGILTCSSLLPHAGDVDNVVLRIAAATLDIRPDDVSPEVLQQMQLPTRCAGVQMDMPSRLIPLARAARLIEVGPAVRAAVTSWGAADSTKYDGVQEAVADGLVQMLSARGVTALGAGGRPVDGGKPMDTACFRPAIPERHLLSKYLRHTADNMYSSLLETSDAMNRTRLLSAAGPTAGASFVAPLSVPGVHFTDRQWTEALRWRLGMSQFGLQAYCQNEMGTTEEICGEVLDEDHAVECPRGPMRKRRHDDLADVHADILEESGAVVRREVFVPEFSRQTDAWLDVWAYGVLELPDVLLDITVRHPRAERYQPLAADVPGRAAAQAETEKQQRYPAAAGRNVWPIAHETWGRLGDRAEDFLQWCAATCARRAHRRGRLPGNSLRRWRAQLDATLHKGVAQQLVSARNGLQGRKRCRRTPGDLAVAEASCRL